MLLRLVSVYEFNELFEDTIIANITILLVFSLIPNKYFPFRLENK